MKYLNSIASRALLVSSLVTMVSWACMKKVEVDGQSPTGGNGPGSKDGAALSGNSDASDNGLIGGVDQGHTDGGVTATGGSGSSGAGGADSGIPSSGGAGGAGGSGGTSADAAMTSAGEAGTPPNPAAITDLKVLVAGLDAIDVPAIGTDGVSLVQYAASGAAFDLKATWDGTTSRWFEASQPRYIYTAARGAHHVALLYTTSYGIFANGSGAEISGTPASYKEFLAANDQGFAWVDYGQVRAGAAPSGKIVFQTWAGGRTSVTDSLRYRARPDLSSSQVAFVEYASTAPGSVGQIVVQPLAGGAAVIAAASAHHQDRPAIDGDWVVWEEYLTSTDAVIRARNLVTGEVRNLSSTVGFRTNPDILGMRVVWEDQRSGNGDIYFADLASNAGERVAVS